jgi:type IV pilus assembly protein PilA
MATRKHGFTLIEMAVVIGVIAILVTLAMPNMQDKVIRTQISEALSLADIAKKPIAASWAATKILPLDNSGAGLPVAAKIVNNYISALSVQNGAIHITFGNRANSLIQGKILTLRPAVIEDAPVVPVTWVCGNASGPAPMVVKGDNKTDVPVAYLPLLCR